MGIFPHTMSATQLVFDFVFEQSQKMFKTVGDMDSSHHSTITRETRAVEMIKLAISLAIKIDDSYDDDDEEILSESSYEEMSESSDEEMPGLVSDEGSMADTPQDAEMAESEDDGEMMDTAESSGRSPVPAPLPNGTLTGASPHSEGIPDRSRIEGSGC
jgi:hypothetical protein